ncbi:MAG: hypothetical protein AB7H88_14560 [Vicinamibacterales bacterium]
MPASPARPNIQWSRRALAVALASVLAFPAAGRAQDPAPAHAADANALVLDLAVSGQNTYGSSPSYIVWNGAASAARAVCATFVTLLLQHSYGWTSSDFKAWTGSTSPNAARYHDTIEAQNGFDRVTTIADVRAGDILAIEYTDGSGSSGHVAVIVDAPKARAASAPVVAGLDQFEVMVVDASASYHGWDDTRVKADGTWSTGVGRGVMRLYADASGTITGYTWSTKTGSDYYDLQSGRHLVIGRLGGR